MANAELRAGATIDFLTADEVRQVVSEIFSGYLRPPETIRVAEGIKLDANGNSGIGAASIAETVYTVPLGYKLRLHRFGVFLDGYTIASPYTNASGYLEIQRNDVTEDMISFAAPGLPQVWSASDADAIEFQNGENVQVLVSGGPASTSLVLRMQGTIRPHITQ